MKKILEDKVAIITGGASGLGLASVHRFLEEGARVVIADIQDGIGKKIESDLGEHVLYIHTDVTDESSFVSLIENTVSHFGKLDIMFNNAGATGESATILDVDDKRFHKLLDLDICSVIYGHKYAGRQFKAQGTGGSIITTASIAALQGGWSSVSYTTAKHAIVGTIKHAAMELSPFK
jgi:NAD(P)-dependent dehydrogenase (short-subunit alcohol dehydrogenase family)